MIDQSFVSNLNIIIIDFYFILLLHESYGAVL